MKPMNSSFPADKKALYPLLLKQMEALLEDEQHAVSILANASALLGEAMPDINWAGFYLMRGGELILGPFQGRVACMHIAIGKGVCGTAVSQNRTQRVEDVHRFPGHIACDGASRSEIVLPMRDRGAVTGVLDIDSPAPGRFDILDEEWLERIVRVIERACGWVPEA